jgi:hypothetical protein
MTAYLKLRSEKRRTIQPLLKPQHENRAAVNGWHHGSAQSEPLVRYGESHKSSVFSAILETDPTLHPENNLETLSSASRTPLVELL